MKIKKSHAKIIKQALGSWLKNELIDIETYNKLNDSIQVLLGKN